MNLWKIVLFSMLIALALALVPAPAHAQSGSAYGWYPGYQAGGANCWASPSGTGALCATAADACWSIASFQDGGAPGYAFLFPTYVPYLGNTGIWNSGLSCAWPYSVDRLVGGVNLLLPPSTAGDSNSPTGYAPPGIGGPQVIKLIGGSNNDPGNPDDNSQNNPPIPADPNTDPSSTGDNSAGDPINVPSGNLAYYKTDYRTAGQNPLTFTRYYNSRGVFTGLLGANWRSSYDRFLYLFSSTTVEAQRADGQLLLFNLVSGIWTPDSDVDYKLTNSGTTWTLTDPDDTVETYTTTTGGYAAGTYAQLNTIVDRNGYTKTITYDVWGFIVTVTDSYNRTLTYGYEDGGLLNTITTPDNTVITFGYSSSYNNPTGVPNLTSVSYSTSPAQTITYVYANPTLTHMLTGVTDENNSTFLTWTYDAYGRALTSQVGTGSNANITTVSYNDTTGSRTVTNALGVASTYSYSTLQNSQKVTGISRAATATTAAASRSFTYDSNGYLASETDWNGNQTTYVNNAHGKPTTINEAVGSPVARTTTIVYDPTWVHLPDSITTPGVTTSFTYDGSGEQLTKKLTDTTSQSVPYSTNGQTRTWTYTYNNFLLASVQNPRTDVTAITQYGYDSTGALTSTTDALTHVTNITSHTAGGLPLTIVDPNGVTTTLAYDARQRLTSSAVTTSAGVRTTTYTIDPTGVLDKLTLPDNSFLSYSYDSAHRVKQVTDSLGNYVTYTLDALGDKTQVNTYTSASALKRQHSATFDALGRILTDVGGVSGETTTYSNYDNNGNVQTITDPDLNAAHRVFDALNRLSQVTDANSGVTKFAYDAHNRTTTATDPNTNATSYVYDGFGDAIQQTSPDTGVTVYHYDGDRNLTSKTDALSIVTNNTFDKLDRVLTTTYPAQTALNVAYTYDQTGTGFTFGIGRLTSVTDAAGSLTRSYDERGNMLIEKRVNSSHTYTLTYTYDPASRVASITYPDGAIAANQYDGAGYFNQLSATPVGSTNQTLATITHLPFGPLNSVTFGNGVAETWTFDDDYRPTNITDKVSSTTLQNVTYGYDAASNLKTITDAVNAANSQTLGFDVLNRVKSAVSGSGGYGTLGWTYDNNGNLKTATVGGTTTTYTTASTSNRLASYKVGSVTTTVSTNADGNITGIPPVGSGTGATFVYSNANRLSSFTGTTPAVSSIIYDAFGRRFSKTNPSSTPILYFYGQDGSLLEENNNSVYTDYLYADGRPMSDLQPGISPTADQVNFVIADRIGTPQLVSNSSASTVWSNTYQPYGQGHIPTSGIVNNLRLPGQHYDLETGFHYNLNRDYMPNLGRYIEADPIGLRGGLNSYLYASGNPLKLTDRTGQSSSSTQEQADDSPAQNGLPYIPPYPTTPEDSSNSNDDGPGIVFGAGYCYGFICAGTNVTGQAPNFNVYPTVTYLIPPDIGPYASQMVAGDMNGYATGLSIQANYGTGSVGCSVSTCAGGVQPSVPGISFSYGFTPSNDFTAPSNSFAGAYNCAKLGYCQ
jgi:RHS repeat-associated protein